MVLVSVRKPQLVKFAVSTRGVRVGDSIYPYSTLESYFIDEDNYRYPQLFLQSKKLYAPLIIIPIPTEYIHDIEDILLDRLVEEEMTEPIAHQVLEFFGF